MLNFNELSILLLVLLNSGTLMLLSLSYTKIHKLEEYIRFIVRQAELDRREQQHVSAPDM